MTKFREPTAVAVLAILGGGVWAWTIVDAVRTAKAAPAPYSLRPYNRWYVYAGIFLAWAVAGWPQLKRIVLRYGMEAFSLPSDSMSPTYELGDWIFTTPIKGGVRRGRVVVFRSSFGPLLKRVVGMPGDTLAMRTGTLLVNGTAIAEPYALTDTADRTAPDFDWQRGFLTSGVEAASYRPTLNTWGPIVIPRDEYFVLGDNRGDSHDSRYYGFVSRDSIFASPTVIYFSWDAERQRVRWSRVWRVARFK